jgi:hypothetical protein
MKRVLITEILDEGRMKGNSGEEKYYPNDGSIDLGKI